MKALTERQYEVLCTIASFRARHQMSPSIRDLCGLLSIDSTNGVADQLKVLERKGYITRNRQVARALFLTPLGLAAMAGANLTCPRCGGSGVAVRS